MESAISSSLSCWEGGEDRPVLTKFGVLRADLLYSRKVTARLEDLKLRLFILVALLVGLTVQQAEGAPAEYSVSIKLRPSEDSQVKELSPWLKKLADRVGASVLSRERDIDKVSVGSGNPGTANTFAQAPITKPIKCFILLKEDGKHAIRTVQVPRHGARDVGLDRVTKEVVAKAFPMAPPPNVLPFEREVVLAFQPSAGKLDIIASVSSPDEEPRNIDMFDIEPSEPGISLEQLLHGPPGTYYGGYDARFERH